MTKKRQHRILATALSYGLHRTCRELHHTKAERQTGCTGHCLAELRYQKDMSDAYKLIIELAGTSIYEDDPDTEAIRTNEKLTKQLNSCKAELSGLRIRCEEEYTKGYQTGLDHASWSDQVRD